MRRAGVEVDERYDVCRRWWSVAVVLVAGCCCRASVSVAVDVVTVRSRGSLIVSSVGRCVRRL